MTLTTRRVFRVARAIDADLYHFHDPELIPTGLALRAHGKRVIYDAHEDLPRDLLSKSYMGGSKRLVAWASERFENAAARRFSGIVAATAAIGTRFGRVNPNTVVVANYPLVGELATVAPTPWRQRPKSAAYLGGVSVIRGIRDGRALERLGLTSKTLEVAGAFKGWQSALPSRSCPAGCT
jgi:hypothetical protein